jgi:prepilin-type N-terminal cleavage/methylation domain-containing protein
MNQQPTFEQSRPLAVRGFTVVELLVVMMVLGLLVAMGMSAYATALEQARLSRTKVIIAKLDSLIMEKWNSYRTRPVPIRIPAGTDPRTAARLRLNALRELMRLELPSSQEDAQDVPSIISQPALNRAYNRKAPSGTWTDTWEEAECLYLIISCMRDGERSALEFFTTDEIGDLDNDGVPEILDGWGQPIMFLRWAPGYRSDATNPALTMQSSDIPDSFDPQKADPRWMSGPPTPFDLKPLIYSFGSDKVLTGITLPGAFQYSATSPKNDPFDNTAITFGTIEDPYAVADNITNHYQEAE